MQKRDASQPIFKAGQQSASDPLEFVLSDETADRHGDIVRADGWKLAEFKKNPIALYGHQHDASHVIGVWQNVRVEGKKLVGRLKLAKEGTSELVDVVRSLIEQRILKAVSVGFRVMEYTPRDEKEPWGGWDITQSALSEASIVAVPANPNALALAKAAYSPEVVKILFAQSGPETGDNPTGEINPGRAPFERTTPNLDAARAKAKALGIQ